MKISTNVDSRVKGFSQTSLIKKTLAKAGLFFNQDKRQMEAAVILLGDKEMAKLNKDYRGKNKTTNVLSFPTRDGLKIENNSGDLGDIFICLPETKREAKKYGLSIKEELNRLLIHGFLHLLGYDHIKEREVGKMENIEAKILKLC